MEYHSSEERNRGREPRPLIDAQAGKRVWKAAVTDPDEPKKKRASLSTASLWSPLVAN